MSRTPKMFDFLSRLLQAPDRVSLEHVGRSIRAKAGQLLFQHLDPLDEVYLLVDGMIVTHLGDDQRTATNWLRGPSVLGDRDILAGLAVAQEAASCMTACRLLCWPREDFEATWHKEAALATWLSTDLSRRYAQSLRLAYFARQSLEHRVLTLVFEAEQRGVDELLDYNTIATLLTVNPKSVGRVVRALRESGAIASGEPLRVSQEAVEEHGLADYATLFHWLLPPQ